MSLLKNGTSRYNIKEYMVNQVAPKYFSQFDKLNDLQIGLFGYITDILSDVTNDSYFTIASMFKEMFPQLAELPESIYNHALIYQLSNIFAHPSHCEFVLMVSEDAVIDAGTKEGSFSYFNIDSNMVINVEGLSFMLDYDIEIISKKTTEGWVHTTQYIIDKNNDISDIHNPFIRNNIYISDNGNRYIVMQVVIHQVSKKTINDTILSNDIVNTVEMSYTFTDELCNFNVFYREPGSQTYIPLQKLLANSLETTQPFCFYKLTDENKIQISFTNDDTYFQPKYNSDIIVELFTTKGKDGNFAEYNGDQVSITAKYDKYSSNRGIVFMGNVAGAATGGSDRNSIDELKNETIKAYSTVKSFTTTNDLNIYFDEIRDKNNLPSKILFMRKRDDVFERLYSSFILFKDDDKNVIPTNTLDVRIASDDIDFTMKQTNRHIVKAGKIFEYISDNSNPYAGIRKDLTFESDLDQYEGTNHFLYIDPFLTVIGTNPLSVAFYLNSINNDIVLNGVNINSESFYQFIIDTINVYRNALEGDDYYTLTVKLSPTAQLPREAFTLINDDTLVRDTDRTFTNPYDGYDYIDNNNLKVVAEVFGFNGETEFYIEFKLTQFDEEYYYFEGKIKTNDYISSNGEIQIIDGFRDKRIFTDKITDPVLIPSNNCKINVYVLYQYPDGTITRTHELNKFDLLKGYTVTNQYTNKDKMIDFVIPIEQIKSYVQYSIRESEGTYGYRLEAIPLVKANYFRIKEKRTEFIESFYQIYNYIDEAMDKLTNNYSIDIKFFNTYGASKHYLLADTEDRRSIDKVNISLRFKAKLNINTNTDSEVDNIKNYIKELIESTNLTLADPPNFYLSNIINKCMNRFNTIQYLVFLGLNNYDSTIQALESDVTEYNIINGEIQTSNVVPEYLNIDYLIKDGIRTPQIYIELA